MKYIVIGCGISGVTAARVLAEAGHEIEILERRSHIAGNVYDYEDDYGIVVHEYGPHIFHTSNEEVWKFVNRFESWRPYKLVCGAVINGRYTPTAFNFRTIDTFYEPGEADRLKQKLLAAYPGRESASVVEVLENPDPDIRGYAEFLFRNDYAPYTAKQWGISPSEIDPSVLKRVPLRFSYDESYFTDTHEAMPAHSYSKMAENMLDHPNIICRLGTDAGSLIEIKEGRIYIKGCGDKSIRVIFTGALDELFNFQYGRLPYRSLRFEWKHEDIDSFQEAPVVAYPQEPGYTRITEYKKLSCQEIKGTSYAVEYPLPYKDGGQIEPYYPVLTESSQLQYDKYRMLANGIENLICCGRLADFKYYNMDQAIHMALSVAKKITERQPERSGQ